jgi:hypothetical protein
MDIYQHIDLMLPYINRRDWTSLEAEYKQLATRLAGPEVANAISSVEIVEYETALRNAMASAYEKIEQSSAAKAIAAKAIYFEYDLDNFWQSNFFICQDYNSLVAADEDWACDWIEEVKGPEFQAFAELYDSTHGFDTTDLDKGTTLYLVARTVAAFGRCAEHFLIKPYALCLAFHDQDPIMRIKELDR